MAIKTSFPTKVKKSEVFFIFYDNTHAAIYDLWYNAYIENDNTEKNRKAKTKVKLKMTENKTYNFSNGIYEITYMDNHSVEQSIMATTSPDSVLGTPTGTPTKHTVRVFNVNAEGWESILVASIIHTEQLTGEGAENNKKKLQASPEYLGQLNLFDNEDLDSEEYPDGRIGS